MRLIILDSRSGIDPESAVVDLLLTHLSDRKDLNIRVIHKDINGMFTFGNDAFCREVAPRLKELGFSDVVGLDDHKVYPDAKDSNGNPLADKYRRDDLQVMNSGKVIELIEINYRSDGAPHFVQVLKVPARDQAGNIVGVKVVFWDVDHYDKLQEALFRLRADYQKFVDNAVAGMFRVTSEGQFINVNAALIKMLGFESRDELISANFCDLHETRQVWLDKKNKLANECEVKAFEYQLRSKTGSVIMVSECSRLIGESKDNITYIEGTLEDVTQRNKAEEAERERQAAVAARSAMSDFLKQISHEMRNSMGNVYSYAGELSRTTSLTEEQRNYVEVVMRNSRRLLGVLNNILELSRIERGAIDLHEAGFDLHACITSLVEDYRKRAADKNLNLGREIAPEVPRRVVGDVGKLQQVLSNLLDNAIKFTPVGGHVTVSVLPGPPPDEEQKSDSNETSLGFGGADTAATSQILVVVQDTGVGMDSIETENLFHAYWQGAAGRANPEGAGIGLALCKKLVDRLGGWLTCQSKPDQGTRFKMEIPIKLAGADLTLETDQNREILRLEDGQREFRILLVDDEEDPRKLYALWFERAGFKTQQAKGGEEAVRKAADWRPDCIIMDLRMPGKIDGYEAIRQIRRNPTEPKPYIIAVSGYGFAKDRSRSVEAGADATLLKAGDEGSLLAEAGRGLNCRFVYMDRPTNSVKPLVDPEMVRALPAAQKTALNRAASKGSPRMVLAVIPSFEQAHPEAAELLRRLCRTGDLHVIKDLTSL